MLTVKAKPPPGAINLRDVIYGQQILPKLSSGLIRFNFQCRPDIYLVAEIAAVDESEHTQNQDKSPACPLV